MKRFSIIVAAVAGLFWVNTSWAQSSGQGVDRLYALDCGQGHSADQSRWSPGVNVGKPIDFSDNCYLIHHARGYLLWDTGITDQVATTPDSKAPVGGALVWRRSKTLSSQLGEIGVAASDIRYVGISHTHPDHVGNVELFPRAIVLIQKAEWDRAFASGNPPFSADHPVMKLEGDHDVFGDGTLTIISTPGHTSGHQSLLVHLPKTGWVVLSGDAVHFKENWDNRRVPSMNVDKDKTLASMQRIADLMSLHPAELWINHDKVQSDKQQHAPEYYE